MNHIVKPVVVNLVFTFAAVANGQIVLHGGGTPTVTPADEAIKRGDYEEAIRILSDTLKNNQNDLDSLGWRAKLLAWTGKYRASVADYETLLQSPMPQLAWQG